MALKRVGVIGGGQLAWMMADAIQKLGLQLMVQTPSQDDPAVAIAQQVILAPIDDAQGTARLAPLCDVITFENEFIDLEALAPLAEQVPFYPSLASLAPLLDKYEQRSYLKTHQLPTPRFLAVSAETDLETLGFPVVLKARRHGYDGKGTFVVRQLSDLQKLVATDIPWLLEEFVPFQCELAVMAARSQSGEVVTYPVVETQQVNQVCQRVFVLPQPQAVVDQVRAIAQRLLSQLNFVGIMGIEFFLTAAGQVLVNETAPRTHNSGHYSLDACVTSQFEQQLRAVCGMTLGDAALNYAGAVMVNLLGYEAAEKDYQEQRRLLEQIPNAHVYWYGKNVARPGRKMGHVTVILETQERQAAEAIAAHVEAIWYGN